MTAADAKAPDRPSSIPRASTAAPSEQFGSGKGAGEKSKPLNSTEYSSARGWIRLATPDANPSRVCRRKSRCSSNGRPSRKAANTASAHSMAREKAGFALAVEYDPGKKGP